MPNLDRRRALVSTAGLAIGGLAMAQFLPEEILVHDRRPARSRVAIISAAHYSEHLIDSLMEGLRLFRLSLSGKAVLLKPNFVEYIAGREVNTNPMLVTAAAEAFLRLGARSVVVAEGPGHQRDTFLVLAESGLGDRLREQKLAFIDLNRDELTKVPTKANYTGLGHLWLPRTVVSSDFIVSMPKVKTHHWAGVTLSMKNMFGIVPGMKYGWPKNTLHWHGIHESILDICATVPISFVIADGIEAMEGNGPLQGELRRLGRIVLSDDPVAADAACARLMGLNPASVRHIAEGGKFLGNLDENRLVMLGENPQRTQVPFRLLPEFRYLRAE